MYAVVKTGGKQYRVSPGDVLEIEKIPASQGDVVTFDDVLLAKDEKSLNLGRPTVAECVVKAEVLEQTKAKKIIVFKMKRRKKYRRKQGHRQQVTRVRIIDVTMSATSEETTEAPPEKAEA